MKSSFLLATVIAFLFISCKKESLDCASLEGTWKMVEVIDHIASTSVGQTKPASIQGDVIITFTPETANQGRFYGKTPTNIFGADAYMLFSDQAITIPVMTMTKVAETSWGLHFVDHIRTARKYNFESGCILNITTDANTLSFKKL